MTWWYILRYLVEIRINIKLQNIHKVENTSKSIGTPVMLLNLHCQGHHINFGIWLVSMVSSKDSDQRKVNWGDNSLHLVAPASFQRPHTNNTHLIDPEASAAPFTAAIPLASSWYLPSRPCWRPELYQPHHAYQRPKASNWWIQSIVECKAWSCCQGKPSMCLHLRPPCDLPEDDSL